MKRKKKSKRAKKRRRRGRRRKRKKKERKSKRYGFLWVFMDYFGYLYRFLWICMEKSNHKPIFDEFGSKRTLLGILVVFWIGLVECNPQLRNICIKKILGF